MLGHLPLRSSQPVGTRVKVLQGSSFWVEMFRGSEVAGTGLRTWGFGTARLRIHDLGIWVSGLLGFLGLDGRSVQQLRGCERVWGFLNSYIQHL